MVSKDWTFPPTPNNPFPQPVRPRNLNQPAHHTMPMAIY